MKKQYLFIVITFLISCNVFDVSDQLLLSQKINNNKIIEVHTVWYGEPGKGDTLIEIKKEGEGLETIKRIDGDYSKCKVDLIKINDNVFKIRFTDTVYLKGKVRFFSFNINERVNN